MLGKTGIEVSEIAFGCASIGTPYGINVRTVDDMLCESDAVNLLNQALDGGINFFDTSPLYGKSNELLGKAFSEKRDDIVLCTKCTKAILDDHGKVLPHNQLHTAVRRSLENSFKTLKTDYVDVLLCHEANDDVIFGPELISVFSDLKKAGLIRAVGLSTYGPEQTKKVIDSGNWDIVQLALNMMDQQNAELLTIAEEKSIGVMGRSVLLKGVLTDKGGQLHEKLRPVQEHRERYLELLSPDWPRISDLATKFVLSHKQISSVLVGMDRLDHLRQVLQVADGRYLDAETLAKVKALAYPDPEFLDMNKWALNGWL